MSNTTVTTRHENLESRAEAAFDMQATRLIRAVSLVWPGAPWWLRAALFCLLYFALTLVGSREVGEPRDLLGLQIWASLHLYMTLIALAWVGNGTLSALRYELARSLSLEAMRDVLRRLERLAHPRTQAWVSVFVGALTALIVGQALLITTGAFAPATYVELFLGTALAVNMVFLPVMATAIAVRFSAEDLLLFPLNPRFSEVVRAWSEVTRRVRWSAALVATTGVIGPFLIPRLGPLSLVLGVLGFVTWVSLLGSLFVVQQRALARLVSEQRTRTLDELQVELTDLFVRRASLTADERARFDNLLTVHNRVAGAEEGRANLGDAIQALLPLLLPILSLLVSSLNLPFISDDLARLLQNVVGP